VVDIRRFKRAATVAKAAVPRAASCLRSARAQSVIALGEAAFALLQGKGSGSGWDIAGEAAAALRFIPVDSVVFDVGANKGDWARHISEKLDGNLRLYLFEPQEACLGHLKALESNGAVLINSAVGERDEVSTLYSPDDGAENASLHRRRDSYFAEQTFASRIVNVISIDSFLRASAIDSVEFMKMDIEGHELFALRGAVDALSRHAIKSLSFEFGSGNINSRTFFRDYWDLLTGHSYRIYRVLPGGEILPIPHYSEELEYFRGVSNYVATVHERVCT
jgi:FkbM family methyltransferase